MNDDLSKSYTYLFMLVVIVLYSCDKDDEPENLVPEHQYWGEAHALKNGEDWTPYVIGLKIQGTNIYQIIFHDYYKPLGYLWESMSVRLPQDSLGLFKIYCVQDRNSDSVRLSYREIVDGHVIGNGYDIDTTKINYVEILSYDDSSKELTGTFEMTLVLTEDAGYNPDPPDTLRFTNGTFHTQIRDGWE